MASTIKELNISRPKPTIRLDSKDLPEIKSWEIGKKYTLHVDVTLESLSRGDEWDTSAKKPIQARFNITHVEDCNE